MTRRAWQKTLGKKPHGLTDFEWQAYQPPWSEAHIPDLDKFSEARLMDFWMKFHRPARRDAKYLVGRRPGFTSLASHLANYASNLATAKACRRRGDTKAAEMYEQIADRIYEEVPSDLRWK